MSLTRASSIWQTQSWKRTNLNSGQMSTPQGSNPRLISRMYPNRQARENVSIKLLPLGDGTPTP